MSELCPFCDWDEAEHQCCGASIGNYGCTRYKGHDGPHVACGSLDHDLARCYNESSTEGRLARIAQAARDELARIEKHGGCAGFATRVLHMAEGDNGSN